MLKADSIQLTYNDRKILQGIYLDCRPGEITGLLGRNGCGKSSLLKIIYGAIPADYWHVSIDGKFIAKGYRHHNIAYLPQHHYLPRHILVKDAARTLVSQAHWDEFSAHDGYAKHLNKKATELSGGELRILETLLVLYSKAKYLLLDEPFTQVSPVQADEMKQIMRRQAAHKGIIVTDHQYYNILEVSHKLLLLHNGYIKVIAHPDELMTYGYLSHS